MRLIVADVAGSGLLWDKDGTAHELGADTWLEVDARDTIEAGDNSAWVRYRDDGRQVEVPPGQAYRPEVNNDDVIDIRSATPAAHEIADALNASPADEDRVFRALEAVPHDHSRHDWVQQLYFIFQQTTSQNLELALRAGIGDEATDRALQLLS